MQVYIYAHTQITQFNTPLYFVLYRKEKPPPVAPGAWLREELKRKQAKAAGNEPGTNMSTSSASPPAQDHSV